MEDNIRNVKKGKEIRRRWWIRIEKMKKEKMIGGAGKKGEKTMDDGEDREKGGWWG